ncbi:hypothetical protein ACS0TY_024789 [Phlomoides rotata]
MQPENSPGFSSLEQLLAGNGFGFAFRAMDTMDTVQPEAPSFAASQNHKEAERKRRERINGHLDTLRALLLCNSKIDKASLLAKVVQRVRELKQETTEIMQLDPTFPTETDEIAVLQNHDSVDGKSLIKASLCCEDRADLLPDLIEILKQLPLSPLRTEIVTLGGRIRNVVFLAGDKDRKDESALLLRDALNSLILRSSYNIGGERSKRRRMFDQ